MGKKTQEMSSSEECDQKIDLKSRKIRPQIKLIDPPHRKKRMQHYWTAGHKYVGEERDFRTEQSPFAFPSCSQTLAYLQWWRAQKKKAILERSKRTYEIETEQFHDIFQRLRVDVEIEKQEAKKHKSPDEAIGITDVDPRYYTELAGRSVKEKFSLKQYIHDTREILKIRLLIGQEKDYCIRIDQQFDQESSLLDKIQYRTRRFANSFDEFLSSDHKRSMRTLDNADQEAKRTEEIRTRRDELSKQFGQSRLNVYFWEDNWRMVKMCQMFLYRISPTAWRAKHDWAYKAEIHEMVDIPDIFGRHKVEEDASLEDLIKMFEADIAEAGPALLYFEDPFDLINIFHAMESQNMNALIQVESFIQPMQDMVMTTIKIEDETKQEIEEISSLIEELESSIAKVEVRTTHLEKYADYLLRGIFRHFVCSEEVLYLRVFVEDTYETCIGPNDANLDSFSMMKWIERIHEELNLQLDNLPHDIVRACEKEGFRQEMKAIKEAEDAARKFELMHQLLAALKRIMEIPVIKKRPLVQRSAPIVHKIKPPSVVPEPTDEEMQYLTFFTDYCKGDDFVAYRAKFPDDFDLTFKSEHKNDIEMETEDEDELDWQDVQGKGNNPTVIENVTESAGLFENFSVYPKG